MNYLISDKEVDNFDNLYVPGFHRVSDISPWGAGLNYTIMYQFPLYRKWDDNLATYIKKVERLHTKKKYLILQTLGSTAGDGRECCS